MRFAQLSIAVILSLLSLNSFAGDKPKSVSDAQSIVSRGDGTYDVICNDGTYEIVTMAQLQHDEICGTHLPPPTSNIEAIYARTDGYYFVLCTNQTWEIATADQIRAGQVCLVTPPPQKVEHLEEDFSEPFSEWKRSFMGLYSNLQNYYVATGNGGENERGNNSTGLWIHDGDRTSADATIALNREFGTKIAKMSMDLCDHSNGARLKIYDINMNVLLDEVVKPGNCASTPPVYTNYSVESSNGVGWLEFTGQVEGFVGIDNIKVDLKP